MKIFIEKQIVAQKIEKIKSKTPINKISKAQGSTKKKEAIGYKLLTNLAVTNKNEEEIS